MQYQEAKNSRKRRKEGDKMIRSEQKSEAEGKSSISIFCCNTTKMNFLLYFDSQVNNTTESLGHL